MLLLDGSQILHLLPTSANQPSTLMVKEMLSQLTLIKSYSPIILTGVQASKRESTSKSMTQLTIRASIRLKACVSLKYQDRWRSSRLTRSKLSLTPCRRHWRNRELKVWLKEKGIQLKSLNQDLPSMDSRLTKKTSIRTQELEEL